MTINHFIRRISTCSLVVFWIILEIVLMWDIHVFEEWWIEEHYYCPKWDTKLLQSNSNVLVHTDHGILHNFYLKKKQTKEIRSFLFASINQVDLLFRCIRSYTWIWSSKTISKKRIISIVRLSSNRCWSISTSGFRWCFKETSISIVDCFRNLWFENGRRIIDNCSWIIVTEWCSILNVEWLGKTTDFCSSRILSLIS